MQQSEPPPSQGLVAGKYEIVRMIGRGGMGSVWEGRHSSLGTRVAIKFIEAEYAHSKEARSRFDNEARAAATIQSKHAIQIHDHGVTDDGKPYIVMELLEGEPLDKRIDRMGRLTLQETARIIQQVCRALARAHQSGIIHRDLKPENIFLVRTQDDDEEIAKVLDFGIAKIKGSPGAPGGMTSSTKTGAVLGTPFFMSPEQARGLRNVDHRTDIWSLGVIAYKCITGVLPFEGESVGDLLVKICTAPLPIPSQFLPGLPPTFDAWFARTLDRDPERRFATATELADALAFCAGVSVRRGPGMVPSSANPYAGTLPHSTAPSQEVMSRPAYTPGGNLTPRPRSIPPPSVDYAAGAGTQSPFTAPSPALQPEAKRGSRAFLYVGVGVLFLLLGVGAGLFRLLPRGGASGGIAADPKPDPKANGAQTSLVAPQPPPTPPPTPAPPDTAATDPKPPASAVAAVPGTPDAGAPVAIGKPPSGNGGHTPKPPGTGPKRPPGTPPPHNGLDDPNNSGF